MTTSSNYRRAEVPQPRSEHWNELMERLHPSVSRLDVWVDKELAMLERKQAHFITRQSRKISLQR